MVNDKGEERFIAADTVVGAMARRAELFNELEWMVDELHGCGDALVPPEEVRAFERAREKNTAEGLFCRKIRRKEHFYEWPQSSHDRSNPTKG